jgi:tocopherol cyclase
MTSYNFRKIFQPAWFQGNHNKKKYFEGWYFKIVSAGGQHTWAFIPGISHGKNNSHSFIQAINGKTGQTYYFNYEAQEFRSANNDFDTRVAQSRFTGNWFELKISEDGNHFEGKIKLHNAVRFPVSLLRPGIMGWYRYVPFMECYHGVVSLDHDLEGKLLINGQEIDFTGGKGYIEKDWGSSMPKAWIWMQTNHFQESQTSFMLSVARIPWIGSAFTGFLGFLLHHGKLYQFATYTGAKIKTLKVQGKQVEVLIQAKRFSVLVRGKSSSNGALKAPKFGNMDRVIHESVDAELFVTLFDQHGQIIFEGNGENAGLEVVEASKL